MSYRANREAGLRIVLVLVPANSTAPLSSLFAEEVSVQMSSDARPKCHLNDGESSAGRTTQLPIPAPSLAGPTSKPFTEKFQTFWW